MWEINFNRCKQIGIFSKSYTKTLQNVAIYISNEYTLFTCYSKLDITNGNRLFFMVMLHVGLMTAFRH